ncbi:MAG: class IV adenylate cyclase [Saprospiraceae bacterium]|nr:class IV adenylate cyclase [Saprospiraceae bacterium]
MPINNVEIKARCANPDEVRQVLLNTGARAVGTDHQVDTYFVVPRGRLKLRAGRIENSLIFYHRPDHSGPKHSAVHLYPVHEPAVMASLLEAALDTLIVVDKQREIYFIDHVKFHIDQVKELGNFVEIEVIDHTAARPLTDLTDECDAFMRLLGISEADLIHHSYSDMLLER